VHLDHQPVGAGGDRRPPARQQDVAAPQRVAQVDDHRERRLELEDRHRRDVERVAGGALEGADAALAQHHALVAVRQDVFGGEQQFLERRAEGALQEDRLVDLPERLQQLGVVHVARPHLEHVAGLGDQRQGRDIEHLGDGGKMVPPGAILQEPQPLRAQPLEGVRIGAGLERAAAQDRRDRQAREMRRDPLELLFVLHRARPRHHHGLAGADRDVADHDAARGDEPLLPHLEGVPARLLLHPERDAENRPEHLADLEGAESTGRPFRQGLQHLLLAPRVVHVEPLRLLQPRDGDHHVGALLEEIEEVLVEPVDPAPQVLEIGTAHADTTRGPLIWIARIPSLRRGSTR
jgi:hypothetical protein